MDFVWSKDGGCDRDMWGSARRLLLGSILALTASGASAQSGPQLLPPTREQVTRPVEPTVRERTRLEVEGGIERAPCALDAPEFKDVRLTLRAADFEGLRGLAAAELAPAYAPFVGRDQPISVVCEIRDRAATILRDAGYVAAVQVPEQNIENGTVRFRVLMAHLSQVRVRGNASGAEKAIAAYLGELTKQPVFNRYQAERYLLLASDIPGYSVRLTLRPAGAAPGEVIGDVTVQHTPAYADFNVENGGSRQLGRWGGLARAELYGLTGLGDRTTIGVFSTSDLHEQQTIQLGHEMRVGSEGMTVGGNFIYAWARPSIPDAKVRSTTLLSQLEVGYPFIRRQARTVRGAVGFEYVNQNVQLDHIPLTRDRLRVGYARLTWDTLSDDFREPGYSLAEPRWHFAGLVEFRQGLDIFGATRPCGRSRCSGPDVVPPSRLEGHAAASVVRSTMFGEFRPIPKVTFALGAQAQYAWKPLLSFEEFSTGNYTVGRGYDPGALLGDRAWGTQAEIRVGSRVPVSLKRPAVEGYAFWDHANVRSLDRLVDDFGRQHLNSVGGGARVTFDRFALDAALAIPLTRVGIDDKRPPIRFLVSLTTRLWPWSY